MDTDNVSAYPYTGISKDLDDLRKWLSEAAPFSTEKTHYITLLHDFIKNERVADYIRHDAAMILLEHTDVCQSLISLWGQDKFIENIRKTMAR